MKATAWRTSKTEINKCFIINKLVTSLINVRAAKHCTHIDRWLRVQFKALVTPPTKRVQAKLNDLNLNYFDFHFSLI